MLKQAWYYITRKWWKSLIVLLILLSIGTLLFSGFAVKRAADIATDSIEESVGGSFSLRNNFQYNMGSFEGGGNVPAAMAEGLARLDGVEKYAKRMVGVAELLNAKTVTKPDAPAVEPEYESIMQFYGSNNSALDTLFQMESIKLCDGRHLKDEDRHAVLIHRYFAQANGLELGDTLKLSPYDRGNGHTGQGVEAVIVGLFEGENPNKVNYADELTENIVISDLQTIYTLYGMDKNSAVYDNVTYYLKAGADLDAVMESALKTEGDWVSYQLLSGGDKFKAYKESARILNELIDKLIIGAFVGGAVMIGLIMVLWLRGRVKETGIKLALGISKGAIIGQYLIELLVISVLALSLACFAGQTAAVAIGDSFVAQAGETALESATGGSSIMVGADTETGLIFKTVDELDIAIGARDMAAVGGLVAAVIVGAALISSLPFLLMKPGKVLGKIS